MHIRFGLLALGAVAPLVLLGSTPAQAKSESIDKKKEVAKAKTAEKAAAPKPVVAVIQPGDNLSLIAETYKTSYIRLFNANDTIVNPDLIYAGNQVRIPTEDEQLPNRFAELSSAEQTSAVSSISYQSTGSGVTGGSSAGNTYVKGTCTWYAKEMRPDLPNRLGNGGQWVANARARGIATGTTPRVGAIAEQSGHVAYVEAVNGNMVTVSEMGFAGDPGVHRRTVSASTFFGYIY